MPEDRLQELDRAQLAQLCREYMLAAQFNSRTGYAALSINHGQEAYLKIAIENWMAASPVYTRRMQRAMRRPARTQIGAWSRRWSPLPFCRRQNGASVSFIPAGSPRPDTFWGCLHRSGRPVSCTGQFFANSIEPFIEKILYSRCEH